MNMADEVLPMTGGIRPMTDRYRFHKGIDTALF